MTMSNDPVQYNQLDSAIEARVDKLLPQMTLAEKVGQLVQIVPFQMPNPDEFAKLLQQAHASGQPSKLDLQPRPGLEQQIRAGQVGSLLNLTDLDLVNRYQRIAVEESRLGIPLIIGADVIHGFRTVFPIPLAEACTWDPALLERASR